MKFVERRIARRNCERRKRPGPAPALPPAPHGPEQQQAKDEVLRKMGGLANVVIQQVERLGRDRRKEAVRDRAENRAALLGGKIFCRKRPDDGGPENGGGPVAEPGGDQPGHKKGLSDGTRGTPPVDFRQKPSL